MKKLIFFVVLLSVSCKKDQLLIPNTPNYPTEASLDLGSTVSARFIGVIKDESGSPISGVEITAGNKTATTDNNGVFIISDASVYEKLAYVTAIKPGYFLGSRSVIPSTTATNNVRITLLAKDIVGTVNAGEEKTISLPSGAEIDFKGNYVDLNGNIYSGLVNVAFKHMPALAEATANQMPGMLYGQNIDEAAGVLETYGMVAVELTSSTGAKLQIDEGSSATIHMPLDPSQAANAPATIPLWHFDEAAGYWIEGGEATLINGEYVGDVTHFSFWNCDDFLADARVDGFVHDQFGNHLPNAIISVVTPNAATSGHTNSDGTFSTYIPSGQAIIFEVMDECGNVLQSFNEGPYTTGTVNTESFEVTLTASNSFQVTGMFYDCNNNPVTEGYVRLNVGSEDYIQIITSGIINTAMLYCNVPSSLTVQGFDYTSLQETSLSTVSVVTPVTNLGNLIACTSISEYITYTIDSDLPAFVFAPVSCELLFDSITSQPSGFFVQGFNTNNGVFVLQGSSQATGSYNHDYSTGMVLSFPEGISWEPAPDIIFNLNNFGAVGGYVDVTFSGTYYGPSPGLVNHTISGTVHVLRDS